MHLQGQFTVAAPQAEVYAFLTDPAKVSRHMPDVKDVAIEDADHFTITARVGVAHIKGTMVVKL
ncbi:MAG: carbon monoxide dehydrogenase, partial [Acidobacteria bacterium]|nr:carbon monoxide dehydrogenase [Acidobacteriota bacterium]